MRLKKNQKKIKNKNPKNNLIILKNYNKNLYFKVNKLI